jgi:hypothetical protein
VPSARFETTNVATPELLTLAVPRIVDPSESVTDPVGRSPDTLLATVAVNVTGLPIKMGAALVAFASPEPELAVRTTVVRCSMFWSTGFEVLDTLLLSPS